MVFFCRFIFNASWKIHLNEGITMGWCAIIRRIFFHLQILLCSILLNCKKGHSILTKIFRYAAEVIATKSRCPILNLLENWFLLGQQQVVIAIKMNEDILFYFLCQFDKVRNVANNLVSDERKKNPTTSLSAQCRKCRCVFLIFSESVESNFAIDASQHLHWVRFSFMYLRSKQSSQYH